MESGRHEALPAAELEGFRQDLEREAKLEGLDIEITSFDRGDGTVDVEWRVSRDEGAPVAALVGAAAGAAVGVSLAGPLGAAAGAAVGAIAATAATAPSGEPDWLRIARAELGTKEISGVGSNPRIEEYFTWTSLGQSPDGVPWCGAFVSFCLGKAGKITKGKGSARAADWLAFGDPLPGPQPGCVVVLKPQAPGASGHVGFWIGESSTQVSLLGGNQSDAVNIERFRLSDVRSNGYRWPRGTATASVPATKTVMAAPISGALAGNDLDILVRTLWGECRGEPERGQVAVVHVIRNRVLQRGTGAAEECQRPAQFSCWSDAQRPKLLALRRDDPLYLSLQAVALAAWSAKDITDGARHYYAPSGMPNGKPPAWAAFGTETLRIGGHIFLKSVP